MPKKNKFPKSRDGLFLRTIHKNIDDIISELEVSPGHFFIANNEDNGDWVAVVKFDDDNFTYAGTGSSCEEAINSVWLDLKGVDTDDIKKIERAVAQI